MHQRTLWLVFGVLGGALILLGCGGGLLSAVFVLSSGDTLTVSDTLPIAGIIGWGLGFGIPVIVHSWAAWQMRPSRPFAPSRVWLMWLAWVLLVGLGAVISSASLVPTWLLPPVHVLAMSLPPLIVLWLVGKALGGAGGSWREVIANVTGGGTVGFLSALVSEGLVAFALVIVVTIVMLMTPNGTDQVAVLAKQLQDPAFLSDSTNLIRLLLSPIIAIATFGMLTIPVPLIEEIFKTLAAGVVARWARPNPARAFLWGIAGGAGFALVENVFNGSLGGTEGWALGAVARFGATMMHCATGGLVGWGWGQLWSKRRPLRLLGSFIVAVIIHGIWNAITVSAVLLSASVLIHGENSIWPAIAGLGTLIVLGGLGLLSVTFIFALPLVGRKLAADTKQLQIETTDLE
ncbi:MAG: PrsW family intramembrane metalloprotease [Chloroflexi bacterium]|nr:PrsW family intramembrane metalloprotease [Chloroflexota bacterium]